MVATLPASGLRHDRATGTTSRETIPGKVPVALRSGRSAAPTTTRPASKEPSTRADMQTRRKAGQGARSTEDHALNPVQREPQPEETYDYEEYFDATSNPYTAKTERFEAPATQPQRFHPLLYVGIGMLVVLLGWMLVLAAWTGIVTGVGDHWNYGPSRTTSFSAVVGHNHDSKAHPSTFRAFEENGHIDIIEMPGGDPTKAKVYVSASLAAQHAWQGNPSEAVIELETIDPNGNGKPDLIVHVYAPAFTWQFQRQEFTWTLINSSGGFTPEGGQ